MEKSFLTESFPFRLFSTVLCTVFVVDAYYLYLYPNGISIDSLPFKIKQDAEDGLYDDAHHPRCHREGR